MAEKLSELAFGMRCPRSALADWQAECVARLRDLERVRLELLVFESANRPAAVPRRESSGAGETRDGRAWRRYKRWIEHPRCTRRIDPSAEFGSVDRLRYSATPDEGTRTLPDKVVAEIGDCELDFLLDFGSTELEGEVLDVPEYGVWAFVFGPAGMSGRTPPCFWEIYDGDPVTRATLRELGARPGEGRILRRGVFPTKAHSYESNADNVCYGVTEWPANVATDVLHGNAMGCGRATFDPGSPTRGVPSLSQILLYNLKRGYSLGATAMGGLSDWNVGVLTVPIEELIAADAEPRIEWFSMPNEGRYVADPFSVEFGDAEYVFVEEFTYADWKGKISYVEYPAGFENGELQTAHEEPFHMSYPYVFTHDGDVYATPETHEANEVRLYRLHAPDDWEVVTTLLADVRGVDPTVIHRENRWWMFLTTFEYYSTKLHVWHAPELTGPWRPHANNPVKTDVRSARPGGTPFVADGSLYRPAQNSVGGYGNSAVVNRVNTLTTTEYDEETVATISPTEASRYPEGLHTLSSRGDSTLTDGKRRTRNRHLLERRVAQLFSMLSH